MTEQDVERVASDSAFEESLEAYAYVVSLPAHEIRKGRLARLKLQVAKAALAAMPKQGPRYVVEGSLSPEQIEDFKNIPPSGAIFIPENKHEKALAVAREALEWCASDSAHYYQMYGDLRPQNASEMQLRAKRTLATIDEIVGE